MADSNPLLLVYSAGVREQLSSVSLLQWPHLEAISVLNCYLTTIPSEWMQLPNLRSLTLDDNHLTELPPCLQSAAHLTSLSACRNDIRSVSALPPNLQHLRLS